MFGKKKKEEKNNKVKGESLNLNDLENVSGGSLKDVNFEKTHPISTDTKNKI